MRSLHVRYILNLLRPNSNISQDYPRSAVLSVTEHRRLFIALGNHSKDLAQCCLHYMRFIVPTGCLVLKRLEALSLRSSGYNLRPYGLGAVLRMGICLLVKSLHFAAFLFAAMVERLLQCTFRYD